MHFRRLVEAGLASRDAAVSVAREGLESVHRRMRVIDAGGGESGLQTLLSAPGRQRLTAVTVPGTGQAGDGLSLPYRGEQLRGAPWRAGWTRGWPPVSWSHPAPTRSGRSRRTRSGSPVPGRTIAVLGAGAEVGPLSPC